MNSSEVQDNSNKNGGENHIVEMPVNGNDVSNILSSDNQRPHTNLLYNFQRTVDLSTSIPEHVTISPTMLSEIKHIPTNVDFPGIYNFTFSINEKSSQSVVWVLFFYIINHLQTVSRPFATISTIRKNCF